MLHRCRQELVNPFRTLMWRPGCKRPLRMMLAGMGRLNCAVVASLLVGTGMGCSAVRGEARSPSTAPTAAAPGAPAQTPAGRPGMPTEPFTGWFVTNDVGWFDIPDDKGGSTLERTDDGGAHWTSQVTLSFPRVNLEDMRFLDSQHAFVVALEAQGGNAQAALYATSDGLHWGRRSLPAGSVGGLDFVNAMEGWVLVDEGRQDSPRVFHTIDGGASWQPLTTVLLSQSVHVEGVHFEDSHRGWIAGWTADASAGISGGGPVATPMLLSTVDGGVTWAQQALPAPAGVAFPQPIRWVEPPHFLTPSLAVAAADTGTKGAPGVVLYFSTDAGRTWTETHTLPADAGVWAEAGASHTWACSGATIYGSTSSGRRWSRLGSLPAGWRFYALQFVDPAVGYAIAYSDATQHLAIFRTGDGGRGWQQLQLTWT